METTVPRHIQNTIGAQSSISQQFFAVPWSPPISTWWERYKLLMLSWDACIRIVKWHFGPPELKSILSSGRYLVEYAFVVHQICCHIVNLCRILHFILHPTGLIDELMVQQRPNKQEPLQGDDYISVLELLCFSHVENDQGFDWIWGFPYQENSTRDHLSTFALSQRWTPCTLGMSQPMVFFHFPSFQNVFCFWWKRHFFSVRTWQRW